MAIGPDSADAFRRFWQEHDLPFTGVPDPQKRLLRELKQEVIWWRLGRMPAVLIIDRDGKVVWSHRGSSMQDIPDNETILDRLARLAQSDER